MNIYKYQYKVFYDNKRYWQNSFIMAKNKEEALIKAIEREESKIRSSQFHTFEIPKSYIKRCKQKRT